MLEYVCGKAASTLTSNIDDIDHSNKDIFELTFMTLQSYPHPHTFVSLCLNDI